MVNYTTRTLFLVKPKGANHIGEMLTILQKRGFKIVRMAMIVPTQELIEAHYDEHKDKDIFPKMVNMMMAGPIAAFDLELENEFGTPAFQTLRNMLGHFDPDRATPGTIRFEYGNFTHGSDSVEAVERELTLWFH